MFPISTGSSNLVKTIPIIAETPCTANFSIELQISPPKIFDERFSFSSSLLIGGGLIIF